MANAVARDAVAAAPDRDREVVLAGPGNGHRDVRDVDGPHDDGGPPIEHGVEGPSARVEVRVSRSDDVTTNPAAERVQTVGRAQQGPPPIRG